MGKLLRTLRFIAILLFVSVGLAMIAFSLPFTGWKALSVQTGSMKPAIPPGSLVLVHRVSPDSLKKGDVITYKSKADPGVTITHRVQERIGRSDGPKQTIVKGDANKIQDAPVYDTQIVGRVAGSAPLVGRGLDFLKTPWGLALLIYVPIILIFISETRLLVQRLTKLELDKQKAALEKERANVRPEPAQAAETPSASAIVTPAPKHKPKRRMVGGLSVLVAAGLGMSLIAPTFATLESEATLDNNIISTIETNPPEPQARILIERIDFPKESRSYKNDHWEKRKDPVTITLYGTKGWSKLDLRGWTLASSGGELHKFTGNKWKRLDERTVRIKLKSSQTLATNGDFLVLKDANGTVVDGTNWGTNTSQFSPSIQGVDPGESIKRIRHQDTDSAADWKVKD